MFKLEKIDDWEDAEAYGITHKEGSEIYHHILQVKEKLGIPDDAFAIYLSMIAQAECDETGIVIDVRRIDQSQ